MSTGIDLSSVCLNLMTNTYTVTRSAPGTLTGGRFVAGSTTSPTIKASVQPLSGADLTRLEEGLRQKELLKVYTPSQLFLAGAGQDPDVLSIDGLLYQVQTVEAWGPGGNFWKAIVARIGRAAL